MLLKHLTEYSEKEDEQEEGDVEITDDHPIAQDLCYLAEGVLEYNNRNISPIFYLSIVKEYHPQEWKCYFLMLELFNRRATVRIDEDLKNNLSLSFLCDIDDRMLTGVASIKKKLRKQIAVRFWIKKSLSH